MKRKLFALSQRYAKALRIHLREGLQATLEPALSLGRQAVALGLETLELARMHERAFATLGPAEGKPRSARLAEVFFTEAMTPIIKTHRAARQSKMELDRLSDALDK